MNAREYYHRVFDRLKNCYQFSHYFVATGDEIAAESPDPIFPSIAAPLNELEKYTNGRGLQVHLPVIGDRSTTVLMPLDIEFFSVTENHKLYTNKKAQKEIFSQVTPFIGFIENIFRSRGMPYLLDYTPSGCHILFHNVLGRRPTEELRKLGYVEQDLIRACNYRDSRDIRRWHGVSLDAAHVFSALGKLAEYLALLGMREFSDNEQKGLLPVTISDSSDHCVNFDNTWSEGSPFMRTIRSPFSLHKKNQERFGNYHQPPLVDVIGTCFNGRDEEGRLDIELVLDCMWDLEKAVEHVGCFSGFIPCANDSLLEFINEYKASDLYLFHREFDRQPDMARGQAWERAKREDRVPDWAHNILHHPNPLALQPKNLIGFIYDFLVRAHWHPRHIANILRDMYQNPAFHWTQDFFKYPAEEKANFWARTYGAVTLWKTGKLVL